MSATSLEPELRQLILASTGAEKILSSEHVQTLWSGFGEIVRVHLNNTDASNCPSVIVKRVSPPAESNHPRGWNTTASNKRKLDSYRIEARWYQHYAGSCKERCNLPALLGYKQSAENQWLILEDMGNEYPLRRSELSVTQCTPCLKWLARFHAFFLGSDGVGLWPVGTYWHLGTRMDEFAAMADGSLKEAAHRLDTQLNGCRYQTLVHGDAKVANVCFAESLRAVSMVDFQYVGRGCGIKDVAYFMGSCLDSDTCLEFETHLLEVYFDELKLRLPGDLGPKVEAEWRYLYDYASADFHRFLAGWMPTHSKMTPYISLTSQRALAKLASSND